MGWVRFQAGVTEPGVRWVRQPAEATQGGPPPPPPAATVAAASEKPGVTAEGWAVGLAYALVVVAWALVWVLLGKDLKPNEGMKAEAVLAVGLFLSQGLERLLEPASAFAGSKPTKPGKKVLAAELDRAFAAAENAATTGASDAAEKAKAAADAKAAVDQYRANLALVLWGVAVVLGIVLAATVKLHLLAAVGADVSVRWDVLISGIAIGSATKPLHDLIQALGASKKKAEAAPAQGG